MLRKTAIRFLCPLVLIFGHTVASAETIFSLEENCDVEH